MGIDMGGTFTDLMAVDAGGYVHVVKTPTTPADPPRAVLEGLEQLAAAAGFAPGDVLSIAHGTTIGLNAVLERRWPPIGLLVTHGYGDIVEVARQTIPGEWGAIYTWSKPARIVEPELVFEIPGRVSYRGEVQRPLDEDAVRSAARSLRERGVGSVAICFLHSYAAPQHEARARELLADEHPGCLITTSSTILPEFREYERTMTTCLNALLMPIVGDYLGRLSRRLEAAGYGCELRIMKSSGGLSSAAQILHQPVYVAYSGPSAGVLGMAALARALGDDRVLSYDMGGTSTDVALIEDGRPLVSTDGAIGDYPLNAPTIDLVSIGAGGGSIASLGTGNRLRVGPESAGSEPGPAAYGRGGEQATVTDANVVLGRLGGSLIGGDLRLDPAAAHAAVARIAEALGLDVLRAAHGMLRLAASNMAGAVREVSVKRGRDPRDYALYAYGGAGGLHAADIAASLGIRRVLVPRNSGLGSCTGLLASDVTETAVLTPVYAHGGIALETVDHHYRELEGRLRAAVEGQGEEIGEVVLERSADLRYVGEGTEQGGSELTVPVAPGAFDAAAFAQAERDFHAAHHRAYGFSYAGEQRVELVNLRVVAIGPLPRFPFRFADGAETPVPAGERPVCFDPVEGLVPTAVHARAALAGGMRVAGPAIIEDYDTCVVVPPGASAMVTAAGHLELDLAPASSAGASRAELSRAR